MAHELHENIRQNLDLYEVCQRELSHKDQLANKTAELYRILLSTMSWSGPKGVPLDKPDFIHGDRIYATINYISDYILFKYVTKNGKEVFMSSQGL